MGVVAKCDEHEDSSSNKLHLAISDHFLDGSFQAPIVFHKYHYSTENNNVLNLYVCIIWKSIIMYHLTPLFVIRGFVV